MARCDVCGNDYARTFTVTLGDQAGTFDCFECAIHLMAPACEHCGCRILGHGVETDQGIYCCEHCAREAGDQRHGRSRESTEIIAPPSS